MLNCREKLMCVVPCYYWPNKIYSFLERNYDILCAISTITCGKKCHSNRFCFLGGYGNEATLGVHFSICKSSFH